MIKSPIIPRSHEDFNIDRWYFCGSRIREYFEVPKRTTHIQFLASREPKRDWMPVQFSPSFGSAFPEGEEFPEWIVYETAEAIGKLLKKKGIWYVCLYYWVKE